MEATVSYVKEGGLEKHVSPLVLSNYRGTSIKRDTPLRRMSSKDTRWVPLCMYNLIEGGPPPGVNVVSMGHRLRIGMKKDQEAAYKKVFIEEETSEDSSSEDEYYHESRDSLIEKVIRRGLITRFGSSVATENYLKTKLKEDDEQQRSKLAEEKEKRAVREREYERKRKEFDALIEECQKRMKRS